MENAGIPYAFATGIKGAPLHRQLAALTEAVRNARHAIPDHDLLFAAPPSSWPEFLGRLALAARGEPIIVVLDEFPWLTESIPDAEGELQAQWDRALEDLPILLVLIGSDVAMMARLAEHDRPLFGRVRPMVVPPLNPAELAQALPGSTAAGVFDAYLITGGYPRLISSCASAGGAEAYARQSLTDPTSDLVLTARLTLDAEFADAESAYRVLAAIGGSERARPGFNDVVSAISDPSTREAAKTAISRALLTLTSVKNVVAVDLPSGSAPNGRLRRYRINDPYLRFWFRFVEGRVDDIARGRPDIPLKRFTAGWSSWRGKAIEPVVHDALTRLAALAPALGRAETVGAWWNRDNTVEIDVVARAQAGPTAVGTIKWRLTSPLDPHDVALLAAQRALMPGGSATPLVGVCPAGGPDDLGLARVFTAEDLLAAWSP